MARTLGRYLQKRRSTAAGPQQPYSAPSTSLPIPTPPTTAAVAAVSTAPSAAVAASSTSTVAAATSTPTATATATNGQDPTLRRWIDSVVAPVGSVMKSLGSVVNQAMIDSSDSDDDCVVLVTRSSRHIETDGVVTGGTTTPDRRSTGRSTTRNDSQEPIVLEIEDDDDDATEDTGNTANDIVLNETDSMKSDETESIVDHDEDDHLSEDAETMETNTVVMVSSTPSPTSSNSGTSTAPTTRGKRIVEKTRPTARSSTTSQSQSRAINANSRTRASSTTRNTTKRIKNQSNSALPKSARMVRRKQPSIRDMGKRSAATRKAAPSVQTRKRQRKAPASPAPAVTPTNKTKTRQQSKVAAKSSPTSASATATATSNTKTNTATTKGKKVMNGKKAKFGASGGGKAKVAAREEGKARAKGKSKGKTRDEDGDKDESKANDEKREEDDRWFAGKLGQRKCLAIGQHGTLCSNAARNGIYCYRHRGLLNPAIRLARQNAARPSQAASKTSKAAPPANSLRSSNPPRKVSTTSRGTAASSNSGTNGKTGGKKSAKTGSIMVKQRKVGPNSQIRCMAITRKGKQCTFNASEGCFCHLHENLGESQQAAVYELAFAAENPDTPATGAQSETLDDYISSDSEQRHDQYDSATGDDTRYCYEDEDDDSDDEERPYTHKEFLNMWKTCEHYCGEGTEEIESTRRVRGANSKIAPEDSNGQLKAQYGRLLPRAMKRLMQKIMCLNNDDVFLDIGHGIGNTCLQAALTMGCESRGIEVVFGRQSVAEVFRDNLILQHEDNINDGRKRMIGSVHLRHGRLEDRFHREFLTTGVTKAYVNNFNGVFAERSAKGGDKYFLDDFVGGLFALMKPGTILVSLHPISLGPTRTEANKTRKKHGLSESNDASFYEVDRILLGKACDTVKWNQFSGNQRDIYIYKYTRLQQSGDVDGTVFMCCNPACQLAKEGVRLPATDETDQGRLVISHCICKITRKNLRRQTRKTYTGY